MAGPRRPPHEVSRRCGTCCAGVTWRTDEATGWRMGVCGYSGSKRHGQEIKAHDCCRSWKRG